MELLRAIDVERIYRRTDELELHRDWVVIPLACAKPGMQLEMVLPDGRILIRPPGRTTFESWLQELPIRFAVLDLSRTPRRSVADPCQYLTGMNGSGSVGTRRYLKHQPNLSVCDDRSLPLHGNDGGLAHGVT